VYTSRCMISTIGYIWKECCDALPYVLARTTDSLLVMGSSKTIRTGWGNTVWFDYLLENLYSCDVLLAHVYFLENLARWNI
jgi:hypothetical protein